jgi:dCTP diphosphatase
MIEKDSLAQIEGLIATFSKERDWDQFHTPKNLIMAATSEMGELAEVLQWKSDEDAANFLNESHKRLPMWLFI